MKRNTNQQKTAQVHRILVFILLTVVVMSPSLLHAQAGFGEDVNDTPIDGGLSLLVAAGVGYGAKRLKAARKSASK